MSQQPRRALVIGNSVYQHKQAHVPLDCCHIDMESIAAVLQELGFTVSCHPNLSEQSMQSAAQQFIDSLQPDSIAFVFYAGHGFHYNGRNYMTPVDHDGVRRLLDSSFCCSDFLVAQVTERLSQGACIAVFDACRKLLRQSRAAGEPSDVIPRPMGMRAVKVTGAIVAYACEQGFSAYGLPGTGGLYTQCLVRRLRAAEDIGLVLRRTNGDLAAHAHNQSPPPAKQRSYVMDALVPNNAHVLIILGQQSRSASLLRVAAQAAAMAMSPTATVFLDYSVSASVSGIQHMMTALSLVSL